MNGIIKRGDGYFLSIDTSIYGARSVKKCAYKFADRASIILSLESDSAILVTFNFCGPQETSKCEQIIADFCNELLDQDLRETIREETSALRNAIIAHAFSRTPLARHD